MAKSFDKLIQEIETMTVIELADFVKKLEETFGVSAAMPSMGGGAAAPAQAAAPVEEKTSFKVTLLDGGPKAIETIKALRKVTPLSLVDAKKAVDGAPTVIAESAAKDDAQKMKQALEEAGAKVQLA